MNRLLSLLLLLLTSLYAHAQQTPDSLKAIEDRVKPVVFLCSDISASSSALFVRYMQEQKNDSVQSLLQYWESKCGRSEPVQRAITLWSISNGTYSNAVLSNHIIMDIADYKGVVASYQPHASSARNYYYTRERKVSAFDHYTRELATGMRDRYPKGSMEYLWCDFYGPNPDSVFHHIRSTDYDSTEIRRIYDEEITTNQHAPRGHAALIAGAWMPTGALSRMGVHPELGFQFGGRNDRWGLDLTLLVRFLRTPQPYEAERTKYIIQQTRYFLGGYFGLDGFYDVLHPSRDVSLSILGGGGLDWLSPFEQVSQQKDDRIRAATSYNFNLGIGVRRTFADSWYIGAQVKYNFTDYTLNNVIAYPGNNVTIRLCFGGTFFNDVGRQYRAEALEL